MNATPIESRLPPEAPLQPDGSWSRGRWCLLIALVFAAHIGLIFALGDRKPAIPRPPAFAPVLSLASHSDELVALNDPTLFALPHRKSFAGSIWLQTPVVQFRPFRWTEPPRFLSLPVEELGVMFRQFVQTNALAPFELEAGPAPELRMPLASEIVPTAPARSTLRITGDLANRRLLNPAELPSWPAAGLLTNSLVQLVVSADGTVMSRTLLRPGSGSEKADQRALELARAARFEPTRNGAGKLSVGLMIFEWHTLPLLEINTPQITPEPQ